MKKYQVKIQIKEGANSGAIITVEIIAKNESAAEYRAYTLLKEMDCGTIEVKEI